MTAPRPRDPEVGAPRVVLDTNVLVSALVFPGGAPETVWRLALRGRLATFTSVPLLHELGRVLSERFLWASPMVERALRLVARTSVVVTPVVVVGAAPGPDDDVVIGTALAAPAGLIVTGDRTLLGIGGHGAVRIVTVTELLRSIP